MFLRESGKGARLAITRNVFTPHNSVGVHYIRPILQSRNLTTSLSIIFQKEPPAPADLPCVAWVPLGLVTAAWVSPHPRDPQDPLLC